MNLTPKQARFLDEYLIDLNATQSAIRAGYSEKTARSIGQENLTKPDIQEELRKRIKLLSEETGITVKYIINRLQEVSERCLQRKPVMVFDKEEKCMKQLVNEDDQGVWTFNASGANRSLELLGKHLGIFEQDNNQQEAKVIIYYTDKINKPPNTGLSDP